MKYAIIQRPSQATMDMLRRKSPEPKIREALDHGQIESLGICQGSVLEILVASDVAEKAAGVIAGEISGNCPQHITCLGIVGGTGAVRAAMEAVEEAIKEI